MIADDVVHHCSCACKLQYPFDHQRVSLPPCPLLSGPEIDDIAIQNQYFWMNTIEILHELFGMTVICSQMCVRDDNDINYPSVMNFQTPFGLKCGHFTSPEC